MEEFLGVSYKLSTSENFDEFMKAVGVGLVQRKMANSASPVIKLTEKNGVYTLLTSTPFRNEEINFKPAVEFEENTVYGKTVKSVVKMDGNKMVHTQRSGTLTVIITREFSRDEMKATFKVGDVVCKRIYQRVQ